MQALHSPDFFWGFRAAPVPLPGRLGPFLPMPLLDNSAFSYLFLDNMPFSYLFLDSLPFSYLFLDSMPFSYLFLDSMPFSYQYLFLDLSAFPRSGELRTQKLKSHLVRTQSLNVLPLMHGVGQYRAIHATLTARDFFLAYFYTSGPFTCIFSKTFPNFPLCWLWLTHGSCVGLQNRIGHSAGCRFPC